MHDFTLPRLRHNLDGTDGTVIAIHSYETEVTYQRELIPHMQERTLS